MILIEQGPWDTAAISDHLRRIQERLYTCLDAALDGAVTAEYPESRGKPLMIRLEVFNVPEAELRGFFGRFTSQVPKLPDYAKALREQQFFPMVSFELNVDALKTPVVPDL